MPKTAPKPASKPKPKIERKPVQPKEPVTPAPVISTPGNVPPSPKSDAPAPEDQAPKPKRSYSKRTPTPTALTSPMVAGIWEVITGVFTILWGERVWPHADTEEIESLTKSSLLLRENAPPGVQAVVAKGEPYAALVASIGGYIARRLFSRASSGGGPGGSLAADLPPVAVAVRQDQGEEVEPPPIVPAPGPLRPQAASGAAVRFGDQQHSELSGM